MPKTLAALLCLLFAATTGAAAQSTVAQLAASGWQAIEKGDADRAAALFGEALTMRPNDPVLNLGGGVAAHPQGHDEQLLEDLDAGESVDDAVQRFGFTFIDFESSLARRVGVSIPAARQ